MMPASLRMATRFPDAAMRPRRPADPLSCDDMEDDGILGLYRKMLAARSKARTRLRRLVMRECTNLRAVDVEAFEKHVDAVEWDTAEIFEDYDSDTDLMDEAPFDSDFEDDGPFFVFPWYQ